MSESLARQRAVGLLQQICSCLDRFAKEGYSEAAERELPTKEKLDLLASYLAELGLKSDGAQLRNRIWKFCWVDVFDHWRKGVDPELIEAARQGAASDLPPASAPVDVVALQGLAAELANQVGDVLKHLQAERMPTAPVALVHCPPGIGEALHAKYVARIKTYDVGAILTRGDFDPDHGDEKIKSAWLKAMCEQGLLRHNGKNGRGSAYTVLRRA